MNRVFSDRFSFAADHGATFPESVLLYGGRMEDGVHARTRTRRIAPCWN